MYLYPININTINLPSGDINRLAKLHQSDIVVVGSAAEVLVRIYVGHVHNVRRVHLTLILETDPDSPLAGVRPKSGIFIHVFRIFNFEMLT